MRLPSAKENVRGRRVPAAESPRDLSWNFPNILRSNVSVPGFAPLPSAAGSKDINHHPLFRGLFTRWTWRFFTHRLTPAGRWFLFPSLLLFGYSLTSLDLQAWVPTCYLAVAWLAAWAAMFLCRPRAALRVQHDHRITAGELLPVEVVVRNQGKRTLLDGRVIAHRLPPEIDCVPAAGVPLQPVLPGADQRAQLGLKCMRRGVYSLRGFRVTTHFPFGLLYASTLIAASERLVVYPAFTPLSRLEIPASRRFQPGGVLLASNLGDSFEYVGSREYREGDNVRNIDWRATARLGSPVVREYREEYFLRAAVVLDTYLPPRSGTERTEDFESAVSICAAVSDYLARQDYLVDILAAGPMLYRLTAGRSLANLDQILEILAGVSGSPTEPFRVLEPEIMECISRVTTVFCIFLDWDETRSDLIDELQRQGAGTRVIILRVGECTSPPPDNASTTVLDRRAAQSRLTEL